MLKAQLHIHTDEDPLDNLSYKAKDVIDLAKKLNFDVLSFTLHNRLFYNQEIIEYAKNNGILLIPGIEKTIEKKHVLILGLEILPEIKEIKDLEKIKDKALIIAPHPFFPKYHSLNGKLMKNINNFHAIEHSFFYTNFLNFNKKAKIVAREYKKPFIGTSDVHNLKFFDRTYTLIDAEKNIVSVIEAIKNNKVKTITKPLSIIELPMTYLGFIKSKISNLIAQKKPRNKTSFFTFL